MKDPKKKREFIPPPSSIKKRVGNLKLGSSFMPAKSAANFSPQLIPIAEKYIEKKENQQVYTVNGINIKFPYKAYACQLNMMEKITRALISPGSENALLESPTGSGKSLAILCSVLSWSKQEREKPSELKITELPTDRVISINKEQPPPKIFICSRTHRQISQLVKELGTTSFRPKMAVLGGRTHLCLQNTALTAADPNEKCKELVKDGACRYFHRAENLAKSMKDSIWDIEDLVDQGRDLKGCPYYAARALAQEAEVVFAPYNYLCDPQIRAAMSISVKNSVVIIDEAHNIEDTARESGSYEVTDEKLEVIESELVNLSMVYGKKFNSKGLDGISSELRDTYTFLKGVVFKMLTFLKNSPKEKPPIVQFESRVFVWDGNEVPSVIEAAGFTSYYYNDFKKKLERSLEIEREMDAKEKDQLSFLSSGAQTILSGLLFILKFVFEESQIVHLSDYKMALSDSIIHNTEKGISRRSFKLSFWCLNPGIIFGPLAKDAKSVILTSGTLSPMGSFASELQTAFVHRLEANHVISPSQVWVGVVPCSPNGMEIEGVFRSLDSFSFQDEIGLAILGYLTYIPHGVLCFLPSYSFLRKAISRWKNTGLYEKISQIKKILVEPQNVPGTQFQELLDEYYEAIASSRAEASRGKSDQGGAILFAVYRGKVSEGLDFIDDNARAVIAIGIPFPSTTDIQINAKKEFNTKFSTSKGLLTGNQWYEIQAYRALNQALGRCLRHKNDWGAILLIEKRFTNNRNQQQLSKWVRNNLKIYQTYQESLSSLSSFMKYWKGKIKENPVTAGSKENVSTHALVHDHIQKPKDTSESNNTGAKDKNHMENNGLPSTSQKLALDSISLVELRSEDDANLVNTTRCNSIHESPLIHISDDGDDSTVIIKEDNDEAIDANAKKSVNLERYKKSSFGVQSAFVKGAPLKCKEKGVSPWKSLLPSNK